LAPESFLIAFKKALEMVLTVRRLTREPDRGEFARLVSLCIEEYYGDTRR